MTFSPLPRDFYYQPAPLVAQKLLGKYLVRKLGEKYLVGKIVETESYLGTDDPAAHAFRGMTKRTEVLFGDAGFSYVYSIHTHHALDVTVGNVDTPHSVLLRAVEPISGIQLMQEFRPVEDLKNLTSGPGKLCRAMNITKEQNAQDITKSDSDIFVADSDIKISANEIIKTTRVGISKAKEMQLRFYIKDNKFVSKK